MPQSCDQRGVHVEVGEDPLAVGERVAVAAARPAAGGRGGRRARRARAATAAKLCPEADSCAAAACRSRYASSSASRATAAAASSGCSATPAGSASAQPAAGGLEPHPRAAARGGDEDRALPEHRPRARRCHVRCAPTRARRARGARRGVPISGFGRMSTSSQSGSSRMARTTARATDGRRRPPLDRDELPLRARREELGVDPLREDV